MSNFYAYDGSTWRDAAEVWAYDGSTWRDIQEAWAYDGSTWRNVFSAVDCGALSTPTCDTIFDGWSTKGRFTNCGTNCASAKCTYSVGINWTDCADSCHSMDGYLSTDGGSYTLRASCTALACGNLTGCEVAGEFDCILIPCAADTSTYQGRVIIQLTSDGSTICTITMGSSQTGECFAV